MTAVRSAAVAAVRQGCGCGIVRMRGRMRPEVRVVGYRPAAIRARVRRSHLLCAALDVFGCGRVTPGSAARAMRVPLRPTPRWRSMLLRATAEADVVHGPPYFREGRATRSIFHVCRELNSKSIISLENRIATLDLRRRKLCTTPGPTARAICARRWPT